jgi:AbiV family abortive infection protein
MEKQIPRDVINLRNACLSHAEDLVRAAKRILTDERLPNISYHLAALALEEIGKSILIVMGYFAHERDDSTWSPEKFYDDHVKKLFWATWDPLIGREKITQEQIESFQGLSQKIHNTRLQALYVDFDANGPLLPRESISHLQAQNLINMATTRLEMEKMHEFGEIEDADLENLNWFLAATSEHEKRKLIFGGKSMEKLAELGSTNRWVAWLKREFDKAEEEARLAINQELRRSPPDDVTKLEEKWKIKIRLFSSSHSIRHKPLNKWNELGSWIRLYPVGGKKNQLIVEFTLPKNISVHSLWWAAWGAAKRFVVALNIGTFGCFWWYIPEQISRFYEKIVDLENKEMEVKIERNPILKLDWKHSALSETDLQNTALCFGMLPGDNKSELGQSMGAYITGLAFLNKNDIHLQFEANSYEMFYKSLKQGMRYFKDWDDKEYFPDRFEKLLRSYNIGQEEIAKHKIITQCFESALPSLKGTNLTLSEVGAMKIMCDAYFTAKFREMAKEKKVAKGTPT